MSLFPRDHAVTMPVPIGTGCQSGHRTTGVDHKTKAPHGGLRILNPARLPVPPRSRGCYASTYVVGLCPGSLRPNDARRALTFGCPPRISHCRLATPATKANPAKAGGAKPRVLALLRDVSLTTPRRSPTIAELPNGCLCANPNPREGGSSWRSDRRCSQLQPSHSRSCSPPAATTRPQPR